MQNIVEMSSEDTCSPCSSFALCSLRNYISPGEEEDEEEEEGQLFILLIMNMLAPRVLSLWGAQ